MDQFLLGNGFRGVNILDYRNKTLLIFTGFSLDPNVPRFNNSGVNLTNDYLNDIFYPAPEPALAFLTLPVLVGLGLWMRNRRSGSVGTNDSRNSPPCHGV